MLEIPFDLGPDADYKRDRFPKVLMEKSLEFVLNSGKNTVIFHLSLVLLPVEVDLILEE